MSKYDDELETHAAVGRGILFYAILGAVVIAGLVTFFGWLRPMWASQEREATVESHQYVEARKTEILADMAEYDRLTAEIAKYEAAGGQDRIVRGLYAQQGSLETKIRAALKKIPKKSWPEGSERFAE